MPGRETRLAPGWRGLVSGVSDGASLAMVTTRTGLTVLRGLHVVSMSVAVVVRAA